MQRTGIAADPVVKQHNTGRGHPEQPARYSAVMNRLQDSGLLQNTVALDVRPATDDEIALVHSRDYIELVQDEISQGRAELSTGDTIICPESLEAARVAAGAGLSCR